MFDIDACIAGDSIEGEEAGRGRIRTEPGFEDRGCADGLSSRMIIYGFDEEAFEEANILTDGADGVDIIYIKLLSPRSHRLHLKSDALKRSGEGGFFSVGHVGLFDEEGLCLKAEEKEEGISGVLRLRLGEKRWR